MIIYNIQYTQKQNPTWLKPSKYILLFLWLLLAMSCTTNNQPTTHPQLLQVEEKLYERQYKLGMLLLEDIDTAPLTEMEKYIYRLYQEAIQLKNERTTVLADSSDMIIPYFEKHKLYRYAGHAFLLKGTYLTWNNQEEEAMQCFKEAEDYLLNSPNISDCLLTELYYRMALCYKADGLLQQGDLYSKKTIEYGKRAKDYLLVSESYKNIGNTHIRIKNFDSIPTQDVINLYDSALYYYYLTPNPKIGNYHIISYNKALFMDDTTTLVYHGKYLIDSLKFVLPAGAVAKYYLNNNILDSALYYIQQLEKDTLKTHYNKRSSNNTYEELMAFYLQSLGRTQESSKRFQALYEKYYEIADMQEQSRTYVISQKYDVAKERSERLELEVETRGLTILLIVIGASLIIIILFFVVYRTKSKLRNERLKAQNNLQNQQIEALQTEIATKRASLRKILLQRIELTRQVEIEKMGKSTEIDETMMPDWAKAFVASQLLTTKDNAQALQKEFNEMYANMLDVLHTDYPRLTQTDMLMCILIMLRLPIADICILLNATKQTVWNRRNLIKERLGLDSNDDLEQWLNNYAIQVALRSKAII